VQCKQLFFEKLSDLRDHKKIDFTKWQLNAEACGVRLRTVQRIWKEMRNEECFVRQGRKRLNQSMLQTG
jgi:hypothetical protein